MGTQVETYSLNVGDDHTLSGAFAPSYISTSAMLTVLGHAVPKLSISGGNNQSVFVGAVGITASLSLTDSGTNLSPLDVNTLSSGLSGTTGTAVIASGSSGTYAATLSTSTAGLSQSQSFSLKAGDEQTLPGANALGTLTQSVSGLSVYNHAAGALSGGTTLTIPTVIVGYGSPASSNSLTVSNTAANPGGALMTTGSASLSNVTLNNVNSVAASGGTGSLSATLALGQSVGAFTQSNLTITYADASTYSGASGNLGTATVTITGNVLGHSVPVFAVANGNDQTVITGGTASASLSLTDSGLNLSPLDVSGLSANLSGATGSAVVLSGSTGNYTATLNTGTIGLAQTQSFSLQAGDQQALLGHNSLSPQAQTVTVNVLGHANAALGIASGNNQTIITGGTLAFVTLNLTDSGTNLSPLDVNTLSNLTGSTGTAVVAPGGTASYTATGFNTTTVGLNKTLPVSLFAGDEQALSGHNALILSSTSVTYNVLGHTNPALTVNTGNNQTVIIGASGITAGLTLSTGRSNQSGLASLDVNSLGALVTGSTGGKLLASGSTQPYTATLSTGTLGTQTETFSLNAGDDHTLPGASAATNLSPVQP